MEINFIFENTICFFKQCEGNQEYIPLLVILLF